MEIWIKHRPNSLLRISEPIANAEKELEEYAKKIAQLESKLEEKEKDLQELKENIASEEDHQRIYLQTR